MEELVTYRILKKDLETNEEFTGLDEVAFTSDPAVIVKGVAFNAHKRMSFKDEPKMRIVAPAMIPMEIYRNQDGEEFNVEFTEEQIDLIHKELMMKSMQGNLFNFEHNKEDKVPAYILEAWIVDNPETDKAKTTYGIDVPKGTLMLTTQITDRKYYDKIVANDQIGYSIGGSFGLKLSKQTKINTMDLTQFSEGKQYLFKDGKLVEVEVAFEDAPADEKPVEETETEMASEETTTDEATTEAPAEETETEMAEEMPTEDNAPAKEAITKEQVSAMIDEKVGEVLNVIAEMKAMMEEAKNMEVNEEEEQVPVQLSAVERLAQFSKSFKK